MTITIDQDLLTLVVTGFISGTAAVALLEGTGRARRGWFRNLVIGVLGAIVGIFLFDALDLDNDLPDVLSGTITVAELVVAFVGGVILILFARFIR